MLFNINDIKWCKILNIKQVYGDFPVNFSDYIQQYDNPAFKQNEKYQFVYDKLFIMESQDIPSGKLNNQTTSNINIEYPIFLREISCYFRKSHNYCQPKYHNKDKRNYRSINIL